MKLGELAVANHATLNLPKRTDTRNWKAHKVKSEQTAGYPPADLT